VASESEYSYTAGVEIRGRTFPSISILLIAYLIAEMRGYCPARLATL